MYAQANLRKFDEKIEETIEITETHDPKGIVACIKGMMERTDTKDVMKNTEKAMFIFGTDDKFITEEIREKLIGEFPNVKAVTVPETGHNSFIENPEATLKAIEEFIG